MLTIKPIFSKGPALVTRVLVLAALSVIVMIADAQTPVFKPLRSSAGLVLTPLYWAGDLPVRLFGDLTQVFSSRAEILAENERLRADTLLMQRRLQKLAVLTEQNVRLRELLNSSEQLEEQVVVAELLGVDPNPQTHKLLINKGSRHGVYEGQPVLDARGVMGQVVEVMPYTARVLMLTDANHSLPVQVTRNGLRAIASGTGHPDILELRYISDRADIKEGDLLVTSGMGQHFPAGYPVGVVTGVVRGSGQPFAQVQASPAAALNRSRHFLLVFEESNETAQARMDAARQDGLLTTEPVLPPEPLHGPEPLEESADGSADSDGQADEETLDGEAGAGA